ncbi:MAG: YdcF family protein [Oscillospiraceae bacterium]|nr:YdcF family protein [Oscillospiraceae bacterium]
MKTKEKKKIREKKVSKRSPKKRRPILTALCVVLILGLLCGGLLLGINGLVVGTTRGRILSEEEAAALTDVDCILVLGCLVKDEGKPSDMLHDRLRRGVALYELGAAPKLLMSGDHGREDYDEVDAMKQFAVDKGIASRDVFMDHAGFSTYESIYRARDVFQAKKIIIVTQEYHLYRALYIAKALGLEAYGVSSDYNVYWGQTARDVREVLARVKDFGTSVLQPKPTYLGEAIPISGDGDLTNDENSDFE